METTFLDLVKLTAIGDGENLFVVSVTTESAVVQFHVTVADDKKSAWVYGVDIKLAGTHTRPVWKWLKKHIRDGSKAAAAWDCCGGQAESACRIWTLMRFAIVDWLKDE